MRKFFFLLIALLVSATTVSGQKGRVRDVEYFPRNEFYIQYGTPTVLELVTLLGKPVIPSNTEGKTSDHVFTGVAGLGYTFTYKEPVSFGIYAGASYSSAEITADDLPLYKSAIAAYTLMFSGAWTYYYEGALKLSSAIFLGINYRDEEVTPHTSTFEVSARDRFQFAYHFTACKVRYGETFGAFAEVGFGYRGLVNIGLSIEL